MSGWFIKWRREHDLQSPAILGGGCSAGATTAIAQPTSPLPFLINMQSDPLLPKATGKRFVICGGGWAGRMYEDRLG